MPDLGEGLVEARVIALYVAAGYDVAEDQPLGAFETDKAVVDIPCPWFGQNQSSFRLGWSGGQSRFPSGRVRGA